ncbi:MAG: GTP-binding protein [Pelistega sp.]|nr:GTP-binding protein [Pelistega sp.]
MSTSLDIVILSGFLGSGKTTLLLDWLRQYPDEQVGIIVNEAGSIDIDGELVHNAQVDKPIKRLPSGCLCCTLQSDVVDTVMELLDAKYELDSKPLEKIIIETSGLSKPISIVSPLLNSELRRLNLNIQVVCVFDQLNGVERINHSAEAATQLASAQRIVFNKLDIPLSSPLDSMISAVRAINPLAELYISNDRSSVLENLFSRQVGYSINNAHELLFLMPKRFAYQHPNIKIFSKTYPGSYDLTDIAEKIEDLSFMLSERLLRSKCIFSIRGVGTVLMQSVGYIFSNPQLLNENHAFNNQVVFICQDIEETELERVFDRVFNMQELDCLVL